MVKLVRMIAALVMWGMIIWIAANFGLKAGLVSVAILVCSSIIEVANDWIEKGG